MSTDPLIGKTLGDYTVVDILGHGGMARVYRGFDKKLNRYAAVKVIEAHLIASPDQDEYRQRFQNEARAIARLNHPNIVGVYQFDQVGTIYYMAMSFIEGRDLRSHLRDYARKNTYMPYPEVLRVIRDIGSALDYAHREGVIHRDIKPSNIMVTPEGRAVLTDFGLALSVSEGTVGNTFGSAHYIAPEQAVSSAQAVPQSDLYSLGVVLFEMLTNSVPFNDQNAMSVALKHLNEQPQPPSRLNPNLSQRADQVVMKSLDKSPAKRYENGFALAQALEFAFSVAGDTDPKRLLDRDQVAVLPSWSSPSKAAVIADAAESATSGRSNLEVARALEPSRPSLSRLPGVMDDTPTMTDSKKSEATRRAMMQAQQKRGQRNRLVAGITVIVAAGILAVVLLMNSTSGAVANQSATSTARAALEVTGTAGQGVAEAVFPTAIGAVEGTKEVAIEPTLEASATEIPAETETTVSNETSIPAADIPAEVVSTGTNLPGQTSEPPSTPGASVAVFPTNSSDVNAAPTADDSAEKQVLLRYDGNSLVLLNRSQQDVDVSGLTYVQTAINGDDLIFESRFWAGGSRPTSDLPGGNCFEVLKDTDVGTVGPPPDYCGKRHAWARVSVVRWFWLSDDPNVTFEVRRGDAVLAICPVSTGSATECAVDVHRGP
ncbi:MAG: protein kinase [Chloroflexota bacterium]